MARIAGPANIHGLTRSSHRPGSDSASLFNNQYNNIAPPIPPMMASSALAILMAKGPSPSYNDGLSSGAGVRASSGQPRGDPSPPAAAGS